MDDGLLSLKWNHHQSTFFHILSQLRKSETFTDATIACEGKFFPVHRLVMSTCSDYFGDIFEKTTCKCPVVILKDIKPQEIESLLDYMYYGEVDVKQSELSGLIKAAECLRIKGLAVPDEDPTSTSSKKTSNALVNLVEPELKSPSAKRLRKDSEDSHHCNTSNKVARFQSSSVQNSVSVRSHSTSVPSQSPAADSLMQPIPITVYSETSNEKSSTSILLSQPSARVSVPVDFIKVEETMGSGKKSYQATLNKESDDNCPTDRISAIENKEDDNHFQDFPNSQSGVSKDDADLSSYNGTDLPQPGPSGFQGETTSEIMSWNEENSFPHIFTNEDGIPQQVCIAAMDPEMVAVRMFQGSKIQTHRLQQQYGIDVTSSVNQPKLLLVQDASTLPQISSVTCVNSKPAGTGNVVTKRMQSSGRRRRTPLQVSLYQPPQQIQFIEAHSELQPSKMVTSLQPLEQATLQPLQAMNPYKVDIVSATKNDSTENAIPIQQIEEQDKVFHLQDEHSSEGNENNNNSTPQDLSSSSSRRLHVCPFCQYRTRSKVDLNKHVRVHTKEKPFKCHICKYETGDRSNFKRHIAGVHKILDFEVPSITPQKRNSSSSYRQSSDDFHEDMAEPEIGSSSNQGNLEELEVIAMPFPDHCPSTSSA